MGERTITNILSKREPKHNRSIYLHCGYNGDNVLLLLRFFSGGEFFNTLTELEKATIIAESSFRPQFQFCYDFEGDADVMIYESEDASVFATVRVDPNFYYFKDSTNDFRQYLVGEKLYIPIDEFVNFEDLGCSALAKKLVAQFVRHYNIKPFTKENCLALEKEFFSEEGEDALNESNKLFIKERFCKLDDFSLFVNRFYSTPMGKKYDALEGEIYSLSYVGSVLSTPHNSSIVAFAPSYPLTILDELDVTKPLVSFASFLSIVATKEGVGSYELGLFRRKNSLFLDSYIESNIKEIRRLKMEFQRHSDVPLLEGVDEKVVIKCFALMNMALELRDYCREFYAQSRAFTA